jgi:hypothetical protein
MSKAIAGAGMLAGAGTLAALAYFDPALLASPFYDQVMYSLAAGGIAMEAGAIADALVGNRGQNVTTRMAAGLRQVVYGVQRVGATTIYQSTTGAGGSGGNYIFNAIDIVAAHTIDGYQNLYLDGNCVYWSQTPSPRGRHANVGCGTLTTPPTCTYVLSAGAILSIGATGGAGLANIKPQDGYRVVITDPTGKGAVAWAYNAGTPTSPSWSVTVEAGGSGYTAPTIEIQGAFTFGGFAAADQQDPTLPGFGLGYGIGPGGQPYNFANKVYCEPRFGDQVAGDTMAELTYNDPNWAGTGGQSPQVLGCAYLYVQLGYDTVDLPNLAQTEKRVTVNGKNDIYDPRTGATRYTLNWALQVADVLGNTGNGLEPSLGLGDGPVSAWPSDAIDQLIAAANVCDESITTSQGAEPQWTQSVHYDTATGPGDALRLMMPTAAGRLSRIGGGWYIWPAYWQGPSFEMDQSALIGPIQWTPYRSLKDLFNRVNGTYVAPNYPYSTKTTGGIPGQLYDQNGWYYGTIDNLWPFAFQPTSFPQYAVDVRHGYASDEYLIEDGGAQLPKELTLRGCLSVVQAQRASKVVLLRNRAQGSGSFPMSLAAWQMQETDVMQFTIPALGWNAKILEIDRVDFSCEPLKKADSGSEEEDSPVPALTLAVKVIETSSSIYEWSEDEELTPYDVPAAPNQIPYTPAAPTSLTVTSGAATAVIGADGVITPRALLQWTAPEDSSVTQIEIQYQLVGASVWQQANPSTVDVDLFEAYVGPLVAGQTYNFQARSLRPNGAASTWVGANGELISITLSTSVTSGLSVAPPGTLVAYAVSGGTADIVVNPFTAAVGNVTVSCLPAGPYTLTGLNCGEEYFVYYIDPDFLGGAITPIATQNEADFLNKQGYFLIGAVDTPAAAAVLYRPSSYAQSGNIAVVNPALAYSGNPTTYASVLGEGTGTHGSPPDTAYGCQITYSGFGTGVTSGSKTLTVLAGTTGNLTNCSLDIQASLDGGSTWTSLLSTTNTALAQAPYTLTGGVPSGQNVADIQVQIITTGSTAATSSESVMVGEICDINVQ